MDFLGTKKLMGLRFERAAEVYLVDHGLEVLERNFTCKVGEIDLILLEAGAAGRKPTLVFAEVRSRDPARSWEDPFASVGVKKRFRLRRAIEFYLWRRGPAFPRHFDQIRIDVLGTEGRGWEWRKGIEL